MYHYIQQIIVHADNVNSSRIVSTSDHIYFVSILFLPIASVKCDAITANNKLFIEVVMKSCCTVGQYIV